MGGKHRLFAHTHVPRALAFLLLITALYPRSLGGQSNQPLDRTRDLPATAPARHATLAEQYIWTAGEVTCRRPDAARYPWNRPTMRTTPQRFRVHFHAAAPPPAATLWVAGPRGAHVLLNGHRVADFFSNIDEPIGIHVFHTDVSSALRAGDNVLAIEAVRGRGIVSGGGPLATQQLTYGEVLAVKLVPASFGVDAAPLLISDTGWRATPADTSSAGWSDPKFDDSRWPPVAALGPVESNVDFFQWSADAGMYAWPGYLGMSPALRTYPVIPVAVTHVFQGRASFEHLDALTDPQAGLFTITNPGAETQTDAEAPSLLLDLGREVAGRVLVESASATPATLSIAYGESELEALATGVTTEQQGGNYLGTNLLEVPPNTTARGPKSGFRYVRIRFLRGAPIARFASIRVEGIYYPVQYAGRFHSSDPLLDRIWETGAYTAHLCMQDDIWDAVKRDRGRWVGDLDIEGRVIATAFGEKVLVEQTLRALVPAGSEPVNGIPSYSALWVTSLEALYQYTGDRTFLKSQHGSLLRILATMDAGLDQNGLFHTDNQHWLFVDWSPGFYGFTPEARLGTQLQYVRAYRAAATLLTALDDSANAARYQRQAARALAAAETQRNPDRVPGLNPGRDVGAATYGPGWQLNALGVLTEPASIGAILWTSVLSHVKQDAPTDPVISPYFNAYVLDAMASTGHKRQALDWMRAYWGGMLAEGATSFWESYDLRWPKNNPHLSLQADGTSGFFVSLAHGWSSGPTAWLSENVLGITPASPGYDSVSLQPELLGLDFAEGSVPTPHGTITLRIDRRGVSVTLPPGVEHASIAYTPADAHAAILLDGSGATLAPAADGRIHVDVSAPGLHTLGPKP
jgi:hypothetical protein